MKALRAGSESSNGDQSTLDVASLEVAILDVNRPRRAFRRINRATLENLLRELDSNGSSDGDGDGDGDESESNGGSPG